MRFLGIDYGSKRIGIAVSDENITLAFPQEILPNDVNTFKRLGEILKKDNILEIVVGESLDFLDQPNALSVQIDIFILELQKRFKLPIHKQKEFLTSAEARKSKNNKMSFKRLQTHTRIKHARFPKVDASAAALILQRYLDKINK